MSEQTWNFIKKETPALVFSCDFLEIFSELLFLWNISGHLLYHYYFLLNLLNVYLLVFCFYCICCCSTYRVNLPSSFLFESMNWWCKKDKKRENSSECFTHVLGKIIRFFNKSSPKCLGQQNWKFSSTILQ